MAGTTKARSGWTLGTDDPATVLAEARKALFIMAGLIAVIWIIQIVNWADHYQLTYHYGITPHDVGSLPYILTAPFLHFSWAHIEGNSGPLFIFGFIAAYRGIRKFLGVTVLIVLTSGLAAWLTESGGSVGAGASGLVFGYFGYIMVRGFFDRHAIDLLIGAVMALSFAYQFTVLVPQAGIGWQAHIGGLVGRRAGGLGVPGPPPPQDPAGRQARRPVQARRRGLSPGRRLPRRPAQAARRPGPVASPPPGPGARRPRTG